jgi:hypothetical protein
MDASLNLLQTSAIPFEHLQLVVLTEEVQFPNGGLRLKENDTEYSVERAANVPGLFHRHMAAPPFHKYGEVAVEIFDEHAYLELLFKSEFDQRHR